MWQEVKEFVKPHLRPADQILAPDGFQDALPNVSVYQSSYIHAVAQFDWLLLHKGMLDKIHRGFLKQSIAQFHPVFANSVFVVFAKRADVAKQPVDPIHLQVLLDQVNLYERLINAATQLTGTGWQKRVRNWLGISAEMQIAQLNAAVDCIDRIDRNTKQLHLASKRIERIESESKQPAGTGQFPEAIKQLQQQIEALQQQIAAQDIQQRTWVGHLPPIAQLSWAAFQIACRTACQTTYLGNDTLLCRVLGKYLLYADSQDRGIVPHLCSDGFWETWMTLAVARVLQPGWQCIDVGANHGYYTLLMADAIGASGRILALEPNPKLAALLQQTLDVNGFSSFTTVVAKAAIDQPGLPMQFVIPQGKP